MLNFDINVCRYAILIAYLIFCTLKSKICLQTLLETVFYSKPATYFLVYIRNKFQILLLAISGLTLFYVIKYT